MVFGHHDFGSSLYDRDYNIMECQKAMHQARVNPEKLKKIKNPKIRIPK